MSTIFISHSYSADPSKSRSRVANIARLVVLDGDLPLAPQIYLPEFIDEGTERDLALRVCLKLVGLADEVRVYGMISKGMRLEITEARRLGIPVVAGDEDGKLALTGEPPR
jgi:hypothetical protein